MSSSIEPVAHKYRRLNVNNMAEGLVALLSQAEANNISSNSRSEQFHRVPEAEPSAHWGTHKVTRQPW